EAEFEAIRKHGTIGVKILEPLKDMSEILPWILSHPEKWYGTGYPHGLAGEAIPEGAQIIALADVFDALTTGRDYKVAFSFDDAIKEIVKNKGSQFNPRLVDIFLEIAQSLQKK
ncbi:MAG: HD domain-containing protein, partial [Candidatus Omnitrophica bacterium]|nr:HD domain-containing protein [Candidatus Omnitrophota bacterium]